MFAAGFVLQNKISYSGAFSALRPMRSVGLSRRVSQPRATLWGMVGTCTQRPTKYVTKNFLMAPGDGKKLLFGGNALRLRLSRSAAVVIHYAFSSVSCLYPNASKARSTSVSVNRSWSRLVEMR